MPRLAIVISAVGSTESLESTLVSVLENRPADCEILVAQTAPYADPYDLKEEVRFLPPPRNASINAALGAAIAATRAPFVHLLSSGCQVSEGWAESALARFGDRQLGSVAPLVRNSEHRELIFAAGVGYWPHGKRILVACGQQSVDAAARQAILGPCGFAGFYRKAAIEQVGGICTKLGSAQADVDLAMLLKAAGFTTALEPRSTVFATAEADPDPRGLRRALHGERLFWRNLPAEGRAAALVRHAAMVLLETAASFGRPRMISQLAGRFWACLEFGGHARHRRRLADLAAIAARHESPEHLRIDRARDLRGRTESNRARVA